MRSKKSRKRWLYFCAAMLVIAVALSGFIRYSYFTPVYISSSSFNRTYTIIEGDSSQSLSIEITTLNSLKQPISGAAVHANASLGSASSCTTLNGSCFISYSPPKVAYNKTAIISISSGNAKRYINVTITPDLPAQLILYGNATNQSVYTGSSVKYTVKAVDRFGNLVPNGTIVNFSLSGAGYLSANSCITTNGMCNVTFTAPSKPETAIIHASSAGISSQSILNVLSRLIKTQLFKFGGSGNSSTFCLYNKPYIFTSMYLTAGENITWSINQPLYISYAFVLDNQSAYNKFVGMIYNATNSAIAEMNFYKQCKLMENGTWVPASSLPISSAYCSAGPPPNIDTANPYLAIGSSINGLNPVAYAYPTAYEGNISFIAPSSGQYTFIILAAGLNPIYVSQEPDGSAIIGMQFNICYNTSYIYRTTVLNGSQ